MSTTREGKNQAINNRAYQAKDRLCIIIVSALEHCRKMKFRKYFHLRLISNFLCCYRRVILRCVVQAFIFGVVGTISKTKSVCAVEMTMYVHWIYIKI